MSFIQWLDTWYMIWSSFSRTKHLRDFWSSENTIKASSGDSDDARQPRPSCVGTYRLLTVCAWSILTGSTVSFNLNYKRAIHLNQQKYSSWIQKRARYNYKYTNLMNSCSSRNCTHELIEFFLDSWVSSWAKLSCVIDEDNNVQDAYFSTWSGVSAIPLAITWKITLNLGRRKLGNINSTHFTGSSELSPWMID